MVRTVHNMLKHEFVGLQIKITNSKNKMLIGLQGKIVNETRNTLTLKVGESLKKVLKTQVMFEVNLGKDVFEVDGKKIVGRPEDRLKR